MGERLVCVSVRMPVKFLQIRIRGWGGGGESWLGGRVLFVIGVHIFTLDKI